MTREELKNRIPHGYGKIIAKNAGVTPKSVSHFMNGRTNSRHIEMVALKILVELNEEKEFLVNKIN